MNGGVAVLDVLLAVAIPVLALGVLLLRDLFRAVVLFIVFGLAVALVWVRLDAPDVALAEVGVGAGITGALFMRALGALPRRLPRTRPGPAALGPAASMAAAALIAGTVGSLLVWALTRVPGGGPTLGPAVAGALPQAGVGNPVTAVLLNIRGYDTLLEVGVLVLATLGVSVVGARTHAADFARPHVRGSLLDAFVHLTLPVLVMVAAYLLWVGADHPGGAFQGAAVLAGGWLVAALAGAAYDVPARTMTGVLTGGFGVYLAVAAAMLPLNGALLGFVPATAKWWLLLIESGLLLSCAAILATLVFRLVDDDPAGPRP